MLIAGFLYALSCGFIANSSLYIFQYKDKKRLLLGLALFSIGMGNLQGCLYLSGHIAFVPYFYGSFPFWESIAFASFFIIFNIAFNSHNRWDNLAFLYPFTEIILYLLFHIRNYPHIQSIIKEKILTNQLSFYPNHLSYTLASIIGVSFYGYIIGLILVKVNFKSIEKKIRFKVIAGIWVFIIIVLYLFGLVIKYLFVPYPKNPQVNLNWLLFHATLYLLTLYYQFWPYYYNDKSKFFDLKTFGFEKYTNSYLTDKDIDYLTQKLQELQEKSFYTEEDISLKKMADSTGISVHKLSAYLNQFENKSFFHYINHLRIKDAKKLLKSREDINILEICMELGYNNPAPFYKAFKLETGLSPKEWLKQNS